MSETRKEFFIRIFGLHEQDHVQGQTRLNDTDPYRPGAVIFWADDDWWNTPMTLSKHGAGTEQ